MMGVSPSFGNGKEADNHGNRHVITGASRSLANVRAKHRNCNVTDMPHRSCLWWKGMSDHEAIANCRDGTGTFDGVL